MNFVTDAQLAELERNPQYLRMGKKCPVCLNTGEFVDPDGVRHECPVDPYGRHEMAEIFKTYCLANIPLELQQLDWESYPYPDVAARIQDYIDNFERIRILGMGWEIYGKKTGVGKTWTAAHILKELVKQGYSGWFIGFPDVRSYYDMADGVERDRLIGKLRNSEILVIDEVLRPYGGERQATFYEDVLEGIIRFRTTNNFPTIITTNMIEQDMLDTFPRVYSLLSAKQYRVELQGDDYRVKQAFYTNEELAAKGRVRMIV